MEKKKKVIAVIVVIGILIAMVGAFVVKLLYDKKIEEERIKAKRLERTIYITEDCVNVELLGGNGEGRINVEINKKVFEELFKEKINPEYENGYDWLVTAKKIVNETTVDISNEEKLSNGDAITITINAPDFIINKYNLIIEDNSFVYEVSDLPEVVRFDPFQDIYFNVRIDENGEEKVDVLYYNEFLKGYPAETVFDFYTTDNKSYSVEEFKVNDEIVFVLDEDFQKLYEEVGYYPKETKKTMIISGNEKITLIKDASEISVDFLQELKAGAELNILEEYKIYKDVVVDNLELMGIYYSNKGTTYINYLVIVYKVNVTYDNGNKSGSTYVRTTTSSIYINEMGENVAFGSKNELSKSTSLIDPNTLLLIRGEKLEFIMSQIEGYSQINNVF